MRSVADRFGEQAVVIAIDVRGFAVTADSGVGERKQTTISRLVNHIGPVKRLAQGNFLSSR